MNPPPRRLAGAAAVALALAALAAAPAGVQAHEQVHPVRLGTVHLEVSCNAAAQQHFDRAMAYYHSFAWESVGQPLEQALQADPACGMAHWLGALALLDNPFGWPSQLSDERLEQARRTLERAAQAGLGTQRERDYVDALAVFLKDHRTVAHRARARALEDALAQVAQRHPQDVEAAVLHALLVSVNFDPADKQFSNQLRAARILEPIFQTYPDHPGAAHYLIHTYDYPPLAPHGLQAARRYARIAPSAPHALHMPSHIFTRVGAWQDSIESNHASAAAASDATYDRIHAYDYLAYAHAQLAQYDTVRLIVEQARRAPPVEHVAYAYAAAAIPARLALERGQWKEAAGLDLHPAPGAYPWKKYPQCEANNAFARGIGAALGADAPAAYAQARRLDALREAMAALKNAYWVEQIDIQAEVVRGLARLAEGERDAGLATLARAADREDATEKHVVTPGALLPARELLGQALLDAGRPREALGAFESVLARQPNRHRAFVGAAQAAQRAGDAHKAELYRTQLSKLVQ